MHATVSVVGEGGLDMSGVWTDETGCKAVRAGPRVCVWVHGCTEWSTRAGVLLGGQGGEWTHRLVCEYAGAALSGCASRTVEWSWLGAGVGRSSEAGWRVDRSVWV